jgi:hypothetical protein
VDIITFIDKLRQSLFPFCLFPFEGAKQGNIFTLGAKRPERKGGFSSSHLNLIRGCCGWTGFFSFPANIWPDSGFIPFYGTVVLGFIRKRGLFYQNPQIVRGEIPIRAERCFGATSTRLHRKAPAHFQGLAPDRGKPRAN